MRDRPPFPSGTVNSWLGVFCAVVAVLTVWTLPIGLPTQIALTVAPVVFTVAVVAFWIGRSVERRAHGDDQ